MENTMVMDTSFMIQEKNTKVNLQMVSRTDKVLNGIRTEVSLQASLLRIIVHTENLFGKMEHGTKVSGRIINFMEKAFILTRVVQSLRAILRIASFKAKANVPLPTVQYSKATS